MTVYITLVKSPSSSSRGSGNGGGSGGGSGSGRTTTTTLSTTTGTELQCTAQARVVNFVVVVLSTTPNKVESRRPAIHKVRRV